MAIVGGENSGDVGFRCCGTLHLAFSEAEAQALDEQRRWQAAAGLRPATPAALVLGEPPPLDLAPFDPLRYSTTPLGRPT